MRTIAVMSLVFLGACDDQVRVEQDIAMLCLDVPGATGGGDSTATPADPTAAPGVTTSDDPEWSLNAVGSTGCHTKDLVVTCDVEVDGDTIRVTTESSWVRTERFAMSCEAILRQSIVACEVPELADGSYVIEYADTELALDLPQPVPDCVNPNVGS